MAFAYEEPTHSSWRFGNDAEYDPARLQLLAVGKSTMKHNHFLPSQTRPPSLYPSIVDSFLCSYVGSKGCACVDLPRIRMCRRMIHWGRRKSSCTSDWISLLLLPLVVWSFELMCMDQMNRSTSHLSTFETVRTQAVDRDLYQSRQSIKRVFVSSDNRKESSIGE